MKISVAATNGMIARHFGHCDEFVFYAVENGRVAKKESVPNPGHRPGFLPNFLADRGAKVIISGGMGGGAVDIFNDRDVEVVVGASGDPDVAVEEYLSGKLRSTGEVCHMHEMRGESDK